MGWLERLEEISVGVSGGEAAYKLYKRMQNPPVPLLPYRAELVEGLDKLDRGLWGAEQLTEFTQYADKITKARETLSKVKMGLSLPSDVMSTVDEIRDLKEAINNINQIDPRSDPVAAGRAYGAAMQSFGRLAQKLPPPASAVGELLEELGSWFHKVVANIVPHTRPRDQKVWREINKHVK